MNQNGNPKNISTGWHAIEFLLWGQDNTRPVEKKPGLRKYTDYTTALHKERRAQYLKVVTELLISDLKALVDTWKPEGTYRKVFEGLKKEVALKQLINGAFFMAGNELSEKRMIVAVDSSDGIDGSGQEDEQSCFADYTHKDIEANAKGIYNVIFGKYGDIKGASFYNLVVQKDVTTAKRLKDAADLVMEKVEVISKHDDPFDLLITKEKSIDANPGPVMQAVKALKDWADQISAAASSIDIKLQ